MGEWGKICSNHVASSQNSGPLQKGLQGPSNNTDKETDVQEGNDLLLKVLHLDENIKVLGSWKEKTPWQEPKAVTGSCPWLWVV